MANSTPVTSVDDAGLARQVKHVLNTYHNFSCNVKVWRLYQGEVYTDMKIEVIFFGVRTSDGEPFNWGDSMPEKWTHGDPSELARMIACRAVNAASQAIARYK